MCCKSVLNMNDDKFDNKQKLSLNDYSMIQNINKSWNIYLI